MIKEIEGFDNSLCKNCNHLVKYVHSWCNNESAIGQRNTAFPRAGMCNFYQKKEEQEKGFFKKIFGG